MGVGARASRAESRLLGHRIVGLAETLELGVAWRNLKLRVSQNDFGTATRHIALAIHVDPEVLLVDEVLAVGDEGFTRSAVGDHLLLGGDNGLRGYPLRFQGGDKRASLTVEQRFFSDWYPFRLFHVGAAAFFDAGRNFGEDALDTPNHGLLKDVGIGLRLGNSRSGLGNIIHVDLAFPLDGPNDLKAMQFLIETRKEF